MFRLSNLKPTAGVLALAVVILTMPFCSGQERPRDQAVTPTTDVIKLFDGKSLNGFYSWMKDSGREDPRKVFRVTDGLLHVTGDGLGGLLTNAEYRDYHVVFEFKWGPRTWNNRTTATKDSGLLVHSVGADGGYSGTWMPSIEVQIIEGGMGDFIMVTGTDKNGQPVPFSMTCEVGRDRDGEVIWQKGNPKEVFNLQNRKRINWYGRDPDWADKIGFRGKQDVDNPDGQWNRFDVYCDQGHIETFVNGVKVNEAFDVQPNYGRLQLQTEQAELFVRRWELWPIGKGPKPAKAVQ